MRRQLIIGVYVILGILMWRIYAQPRVNVVRGKKMDYSTHIFTPDYLPVILCLMGLVLTFMSSFMVSDVVYGLFFPVFFDLGVYYLVLILLMPFLRRFVDGKALSSLWIIPNILYLYAYPVYRMLPGIMISLGNWHLMILFVWFAGFCFVMLKSVIAHLIFRKHVLSSCTEDVEDNVLSVWKQELEESQVNVPECALCISSQLSSALTIGLHRNTIRVILPAKEYTEDQLRMIFRHELIHIHRRDCNVKFMLQFCSAVCWFNPIMWTAMKKCAEDLERSCDEAVLFDADEQERKAYAELILDSSVSTQGFTTCLSSSAKSLKYRLLQIVQPKRTKYGVLILFSALILVSVFGRQVGFAYGEEKLKTIDLVSGKELLKVDALYWEGGKSDGKVNHVLYAELFVKELTELSVSDASYLYKDAMDSVFQVTVVFEDGRTHLEFTETEAGLFIHESYRREKNLYFCKNGTLEQIENHFSE